MSVNNLLQSWIALHLVPGMGPVTCNKLVAHFGSPDKVLASDIANLSAVCKLRQESIAVLGDQGRQNLLSLANQEIEQAAKRKITILTWDDPRYPPLLKSIHDPPVALYVEGDPDVLSSRGIGIVGSRAATHYGKSIARHMARGLAGQGYNIISGLALGIDTSAHKGALETAGLTVAVLGCGLDVIYPPSNKRLYEQIVLTGGALVSEYPFGTEPENFRFPARNRIISGLSLGVVVVEAAKRSGSLITAKHALEQGREVFAVPGRIDSVKSAGTHSLLQQGAKLVHSVSDIVEEFPASVFEQKIEDMSTGDSEQDLVASLDHNEAALFACLGAYPQTIDEIVRQSGLTPQKTNELLLMLELKGLVELLPGNSYQRKTNLANYLV